MLETIKHLLGLVTTAQEIRTINGTPLAIVPEGYELKEMDNLRTIPKRIEQHVLIHSTDSLIAYLKHYATTSSAVFCDLQKQAIAAILDYHESDEYPGWAKHRAYFSLPISLEWGEWKKSNATGMNQENFGLFLERNLADIVAPDGATMLTIALTLKTDTKVKFESAKRLDNGQAQFIYHEEINGSAGAKGEMQIPESFTLGIPVHQGGVRYEVPAKLRYRIKDGSLSLWYDIPTMQRIEQDAFAAVVKQIEDARHDMGVEIPIYWAAAPA